MVFKHLLIDDHKAFGSICAHFVLEVDDLFHTVLNKLPLSFDQFVSLVCALIEEP